MSCKDDIYNNMYNNVMQDTQEVFEAGDDSRKVSKEVIRFALMHDLLCTC